MLLHLSLLLLVGLELGGACVCEQFEGFFTGNHVLVDRAPGDHSSRVERVVGYDPSDLDCLWLSVIFVW